MQPRTFVLFATAAMAGLQIASPAWAGNVEWYEIVTPYLQRLDGISPDAGDASATNTVTHTIDPWPRNVGNRRIPGNGARMSGAVERYRDVRKLGEAPQPISPVPIGTSGFSSPSGGGGGAGAAMAPSTTAGQ